MRKKSVLAHVNLEKLIKHTMRTVKGSYNEIRNAPKIRSLKRAFFITLKRIIYSNYKD